MTTGNTVRLECLSHHPMLALRPRKDHPDIWAAIASARRRVTDFAPDLVVIFGADHWTGLHGRTMPPFSVIVDGHTIADEGGFAGDLNIPTEQAIALARSLDQNAVDAATARNHTADHGISQVMHQLFDSPEKVRVLPIIINCVAQPLPSFARCQALGDAVGGYLASLEGNILVVASGGLSHDVAVLFPQIGATGNETHDSYLVNGPASTLGLDGWTEHVRELTRLGNEWMVSGQMQSPTATGLDRAFLTAIETDDQLGMRLLEPLASNEGGSGMAEVRTWIAATSAFRTVTGNSPHIDLYVEHPTLGLGYAAAHG